MPEQIDYLKQLEVSQPEKSSAEVRKDLVERLKNGIPIQLGEKEVLITGYDDSLVDSSLVSIQVTDTNENNNLLASLSVDIESENPKHAVRLDKKYKEATDENVKGKGLITICTALLFQLLIDKGVEKVEGEIGIFNEESIQTRLLVPDIINKGFFEVQISLTGNLHPVYKRQMKTRYLVASLIGEKYNRRPKPMSKEEAIKNDHTSL